MSDSVNNIKATLSEIYKYRIELHAHTKPVSKCSEITADNMAKIYSDLGYDGIVITNHFIDPQFSKLSKNEVVEAYMKDYNDTKLAGEKFGLQVYFGAEIRFKESMNDYLVYGINREILKEIYDFLPYGLENFRKNYKMPDSLLIQAHPFRDACTVADAELIDGIETFNMHPGHNARIGVCVRHALKNKLAITTAGSDFHHYNRDNEGVSALRVKYMPKDSFELAKILKSGDYLFEIGNNALVLP